MEIRYNVTGDRRKELVKVISGITGAKAVYKFMPTCNYEIDYFTVTKDGTLLFDDRADSEEIEGLIEMLVNQGFVSQVSDLGCEEAAQDAPAAEAEDAPQEAEQAATEADSTEDGEQAGLTVSLPLDGFSGDSLDRLRKLVELANN